MTSVEKEREAVLRGLGQTEQFSVKIAGVGPAAAAANTMAALMEGQYDLVLNVGIAGGFQNRADVGSLVVADEIIAADLGVETPDGFQSVDELGFGSTRFQTATGLVERMVATAKKANLSITIGSILTVSTVTGTKARAEELVRRVPGAVAEAMEGYGVAVAAKQRRVPVLEIRAISNGVGPRNRAEWRIDAALDALTQAAALFKEVF
ncbi:futalosine hydrolase [Ammoniphilus oxalaticus]|uniref:Futalosine hydrolase n=1 Tax=Ammoniphilus oxalaticus TaxID=66863 RepID=A0A419SHD2_9BACL|nr:futalosine hydrolase [Ammoniphilus oxalaticus]